MNVYTLWILNNKFTKEASTRELEGVMKRWGCVVQNIFLSILDLYFIYTLQSRK